MQASASNGPRNPLQPRFFPPGSPIVARVPFVISDIKVVGITVGNAAADTAETAVPPDKIDGVAKIVPIRETTPGLGLVFVPCGVESLRVSVGRGRSRPREDEQACGSRGFCIGPEPGFPVDDGHDYGNGNSPALAGGGGVIVPFGPFPEDVAEVPGVPGRMSCASA